jgi:hypothetical protein
MKNKTNDLLTQIWKEYENGKQFKSRIGLYERVRLNERFYRGDQWHGVESEGLPTPVFNVIRRIASYLVSSVMSYDISVHYEDRHTPFMPESSEKRSEGHMLQILNDMTSERWRTHSMNHLLRRALTDAILSGNGIFYVYYDPEMANLGNYRGEIRTSILDSVDVLAADMNSSDIQSQEYLILSGRSPIEKLRREARANGLSESEIAKIVPDEEGECAGEYGREENGDEDASKACYLIRFSRDSNGFVRFIKCTQNVIIRSIQTGLKYYPITSFYWEETKNCFHGNSPISEMIQNQMYINRAFSMEMKHMMDTAFSKVIYDKRLIPEWTNEVGQAIGVLAGGDVSGAVTTVGVGEMQDNYIDIIDRVITYTKEMSGATDTVLGEVDPTNTSAIAALRETAEIPLDTVRASLYRSLEELALIWLDMMQEYLPTSYMVSTGEGQIERMDMNFLHRENVFAIAEGGAFKRFSKASQLSLLDQLLLNDKITLSQYLERLPEGMIEKKEELITLSKARELQEEQNGKGNSN